MTRFDLPSDPRAGVRRRTLLGTCGLAVVLVTVVSACNGDEGSAPGTTAPPPTIETTAVTTTVPETAPTTAPTTVADTVPPSTTVADTEPTTSSNPDPEVQAVVDAARESWAAYIAAIRDPGDEATLLELAETKREEALDSSVRIVQELIASNQRAVAHPEVPTAFLERPDSVQIDGTSAVIEYCWIGSDIIVAIDDADGSERVVNDDIIVFIERETFEFIDGRWRKVAGTVLQQIEGETSCDNFV